MAKTVAQPQDPPARSVLFSGLRGRYASPAAGRPSGNYFGNKKTICCGLCLEPRPPRAMCLFAIVHHRSLLRPLLNHTTPPATQNITMPSDGRRVHDASRNKLLPRAPITAKSTEMVGNQAKLLSSPTLRGGPQKSTALQHVRDRKTIDLVSFDSTRLTHD